MLSSPYLDSFCPQMALRLSFLLRLGDKIDCTRDLLTMMDRKGMGNCFPNFIQATLDLLKFTEMSLF